MLGHLFQRTSEPAYHIVDCQILRTRQESDSVRFVEIILHIQEASRLSTIHNSTLPGCLVGE